MFGTLTPSGGLTPSHSGVWDATGRRTPPDTRSCSRTPPGNRTPTGTPNGSAIFSQKDGSITPKAGWQGNTAACGVCCQPFGTMGRRHHCRLCGLCVCHACSPSTVFIEGSKGVHRACAVCVAAAARANRLADRVAELARVVCEHPGAERTGAAEAATLEDAIDALDISLEGVRVSRAQAAASLQAVNLRLRVAAVADTSGQLEAPSLCEAMEATDAAAGLLEARLAQLDAEAAAERMLRSQLEAKTLDAERRRSAQNPPLSNVSTAVEQGLEPPPDKPRASEPPPPGMRFWKCFPSRGDS